MSSQGEGIYLIALIKDNTNELLIREWQEADYQLYQIIDEPGEAIDAVGIIDEDGQDYDAGITAEGEVYYAVDPGFGEVHPVYKQQTFQDWLCIHIPSAIALIKPYATPYIREKYKGLLEAGEMGFFLQENFQQARALKLKQGEAERTLNKIQAEQQALLVKYRNDIQTIFQMVGQKEIVLNYTVDDKKIIRLAKHPTPMSGEHLWVQYRNFDKLGGEYIPNITPNHLFTILALTHEGLLKKYPHLLEAGEMGFFLGENHLQYLVSYHQYIRS